jgi:uncharacterized protein YbjQ (UPF0145 family)
MELTQEQLMFIVTFILPFAFIILGLTAGKLNEKRHLRRLDEREQALTQIQVTDLRTYTGKVDAMRGGVMVMGNAVIATDYLKSFLAKLRNIFGGEVRSFETLLARARREAMARMLEDAQRQGYNAVCNIRMDTSDIAGSVTNRRRQAVVVGMMATGTAYRIM